MHIGYPHGAGKRLVAAAWTVLALSAMPAQAQQSAIFDDLLLKLKEKGVLSQEEYDALRAARDEERTEQRAERRRQALREAQQSEREERAKEAQANAPKVDVSPGIRSVQVFGDLRLRYEGRNAKSPFLAGAGYSGTPTDEINRERWRYAGRIGIRGDLTDDWFYGLRLETGQNPRSTWVTFGNDTKLNISGQGASAKNDDGISIGQAYLGWRPTSWATFVAGKQPNPFYTTPMVWDPDIQPEALAEKFSYKLTDSLEVFGNFAQIVYRDVNPDQINSVNLGFHSNDGLMFGFQGGATYKLSPETNLKAAVSYYDYSNAPANQVYTGVGKSPLPNNDAYFISQNALNNLQVLEVPFEVNFPVLGRSMRVFGDFATNLDGDSRARHAAVVTGKPVEKGSNAYQLGVGYGNLGLVYGTTAKKGSWEVRAYWQRIEQYALDTNLTDSDFFEGRANLQGVYLAGAYSLTDSIIGTLRYGYAQRINKNIAGTGGSNPDLPYLNPIDDYRLLQFDLTWRF